ncbi:MAG: hypothetical protein IPN01_20090 [Deltaproteobacteria bacterium]|nr:hypothetical protein [Deltaproteobacteria bacterium]
MRSMFSADGKQWIFGDAFGLTRLDLTKAPKVSKHSTKVFNPHGVMSVTNDGKLALMDGRTQTGAYGNDRVVCVGLPGLGIKAEDDKARAPVGLYGPSTDAHVLRLQNDAALDVLRVKGDELENLRSIPLTGATRLDALSVGPQAEIEPDRTRYVPRRALRVMPDGRFLALRGDDQLIAGQASLMPGHDELWWALPLRLHPFVTVRLVWVGETAYAVVMDHAADVARIVEVSRTGSVQVYELPAIAPPVVTERAIVSQVSSDTIWRRDLISGHDAVFDVGAYNPHPGPAVDPALFKGEAPAEPTRLPGHVDALGDRVLFVPWHGECVVVVTDHQRLDRGLPPGPIGFRRALLEHFARVNEGLRPLQVQSALAHLDIHPRYPSLPCGAWLPWLPPTFEGLLITSYTRKLIEYMELRIGGYSWGSFSGVGGGGWCYERTDEATMARLVQWMMVADMAPTEADRDIERMYGDAMGIPHDPRPDGLCLTPAAERLLLRASLEAIRGGGKWEVLELPESWATEPITVALANDALQGLHRWRSYRPYTMLQALCMMLAHHMGADALPVLIKLLQDHDEPFVYNHWRNCGELIVWLCHAHPQLKDSAIAQLSAIKKTHSSWAYEQDLTLKALARGAKHHWSNG